MNIGKGEQLTPEFLRVSPNNKIPAIVDADAAGGPLSLFESGAILTYLADRHGKFLAPAGHARWKTLEWLNWQTGGLGPMLGQLGFFGVRSKEKAPLAISRFTEECDRLLGVMDQQLLQHAYLSGDDYTIADIACYAWTVSATTLMKEVLAESLKNKPNIIRWLEKVGSRPAVQRGMAVPKV